MAGTMRFVLVFLFLAEAPLAALDELEMLSLDEIEAEEAAEANMFGGIRLMQLSAEEVEASEETEAGLAKVELLQKRVHTIGSSDIKTDATVSTAAAPHKEVADAHSNGTAFTLTSFDHNGNVCLLCGTPLPERLGGKNYTAVRADCGSHSSPSGPSAETLKTPAVHFATLTTGTGAATNGFCELNFARSCVDAIANEDYLYWAKSLDMRHPEMKDGAGWDARYCHLNGFLSPEVVALQSNFTGMRAKADKLCEVKYKKHRIESLTFNDMMTRSRYEDASAPSLEDAEVLAAWNCAMGDLGCDMAMCSYSFCELGDGKFGLYDECQGWDPVRGMAR